MPKTKMQCEKIKEVTKQNIIEKSILYFSKNGFAGTKISDLSNYIGISPGSIYNYFESKEALYNEIYQIIQLQDLKPMKKLVKLPIGADKKVHILSKYIIKHLKKDPHFAAVLALNTQKMLESGENSSSESTYQSEAYQLLGEIIVQGQKEGKLVEGNVMKLVDYYWGVAYLYALKVLFTKGFILIDANDLSRILIKTSERN